jgi:hypothetical protein
LNFLAFFRKPHTEVRYLVPTGHEKLAASRAEANRRASVNGQLAVYVAITPREQRQRDTEAFFAAAAIEAGKGRR